MLFFATESTLKGHEQKKKICYSFGFHSTRYPGFDRPTTLLELFEKLSCSTFPKRWYFFATVVRYFQTVDQVIGEPCYVRVSLYRVRAQTEITCRHFFPSFVPDKNIQILHSLYFCNEWKKPLLVDSNGHKSPQVRRFGYFNAMTKSK